MPDRWAHARALALGAAGGALFAWIGMPLAWMMGAMLATTAAAMAGVRLAVWGRLRSAMAIVLGIMLGAAFQPSLLDQLGAWAVTLTGLVAYVVVCLIVAGWFLRRVFGYDAVTSYFTAAPGGLTEMVLIGGSMGGDERVIALSHSARILFVILTIPFGLRLVEGFEPAGPLPAHLSGTLGLVDVALLAACALGAPLASLLRLPAPILLGPMALSAGLHLAGLTDAEPPRVLVAAAQVVLGSAIGARFVGLDLRRAGRALLIAGALTGLLLSITGLFALALHWLTGLSIPALVLAFSPGGVAEMSLVALALGVDAAFVSTHHLARILLVVALAPVLFRLLGRWR